MDRSRIVAAFALTGFAASILKLLADALPPGIRECLRRLNRLPPSGAIPASFVAKPDDIIVATAGSSGATRLLHICHQLRMRGAQPEFGDQMDVIPWLEGGETWLGQDLTSEQCASPRIFKSFLPWERLCEQQLCAAKIVYCFRDQADATVSAWRSWTQLTGLTPDTDVSLESWISWFGPNTPAQPSALRSLCDVWERRHEENVLLLFYDDLIEDHRGTVRQIAEFMGIGRGGKGTFNALVNTVVKQTTYVAMTSGANSARFDHHRIAQVVAQSVGKTHSCAVLHSSHGGSLSKGPAPESLPLHLQQLFRTEWQRTVTARLGFESLQSMRETWRAERTFPTI